MEDPLVWYARPQILGEIVGSRILEPGFALAVPYGSGPWANVPYLPYLTMVVRGERGYHRFISLPFFDVLHVLEDSSDGGDVSLQTPNSPLPVVTIYHHFPSNSQNGRLFDSDLLLLYGRLLSLPVTSCFFFFIRRSLHCLENLPPLVSCFYPLCITPWAPRKAFQSKTVSIVLDRVPRSRAPSVGDSYPPRRGASRTRIRFFPWPRDVLDYLHLVSKDAL